MSRLERLNERYGRYHRTSRSPQFVHMFRPQDVRALLAGLDEPRLECVAGRFVPLHGRLFANVIVFSARKPG